MSLKVTDKTVKSSEETLKLSGVLTNIFGTKKKNAVWSEVKTPETEQNALKKEVADKKTARVDEKAEAKVETKSETAPTITPAEAQRVRQGDGGHAYESPQSLD